MPAYGATPVELNDATCAEAARWYFDHHLRPIPWEVRSKDGHPIKATCISGFTYDEYLTADPEIIQAILKRWQSGWQVGIALAEAGEIFAVDVDSWDELAEWENDHGELPREGSTWWQSTGREDGGAHALFQRGRLLTEWPRHAAFNRRFGHLEIKSRGFIAVPPSIHPSGNQYQWVGSASGIAGCPFPLSTFLNERQATRSWAAGAEGMSGGASLSTGVTAADLLAHGLPEGLPQDDCLRDLVWEMVQLGIPDAFIRSTWQAVVDKSPLLREDQPWTESDFERHLRGAREKIGGGLSQAELMWVRRTGVSPHVESEAKADPGASSTMVAVAPAGSPVVQEISREQATAEEIQRLSDALLRSHPDGTLNLAGCQAHMPRSDLGSAQFLANLYPDRLHWSVQARQWRYFDGCIHAVAEDDNVSSVIIRYAEAYRHALQRIKAAFIAERRAGGDDEPTAMAAYEERWKFHRKYRDMLWNNPRKELLNREMTRLLAVAESKFDKESDIVVCDNGVLVLGTDGAATLQPHSCERLVTKRLGYNIIWQPDAECPVFDKFISTSITDKDQRDYLQMVMGLALFGKPTKSFLNFIGETDTGKSSLSRILQQVFGTYAVSVGIETFIEGKNSNEFRVHELKGVRLAFASEPSPGRKLDSEVIKSLTGQDPQRTRSPYGLFTEWKPQLLIVIASNQPMRMETADTALMKRLRPIAFTRPPILDYDLERKMRGELPGILRWLVEGAEIAGRAGTREVEPTESMVALRENMAEEVDDVLRFVAESIELGNLREIDKDSPKNTFISIGDLFARYTMWSAQEGINFHASKKTFSQRICRRYPIVHSNGRRFCGLAAV